MKYSIKAFFVFSFLILFVQLLCFSQSNISKPVLEGTEKGLFLISDSEKKPLWQDGSVSEIIHSDGWYFLTSQGILFSSDLISFELRNQGLTFHTIKKYDGSTKTFERKVKELKDIAIHPENKAIMVTSTKDAVYLSRDGGLTWKSLGFSAKTPGVKSLVVLNLPIKNSDGTQSSQLVVCMSHSIYGFSYIYPDVAKPVWRDLKEGFSNMPESSFTEEIASMYYYEGSLYLGNSFIPRVYKLDWANKKVTTVWSSELKNSTQDSLFSIKNNLCWIGRDGFSCLNFTTGQKTLLPVEVQQISNFIEKVNNLPLCFYFPENMFGQHQEISLTELWMLEKERNSSEYQKKADNKKSMYMPAHHAVDSRLDAHIETIKKNKLNSVVIDMKDDYGYLRFDAKTPLLVEKKAISRYAVKLDDFVGKLKAENLYLIARIVVFKDKVLYNFNNNELAVLDKTTNTPWKGIRRWNEVKDEQGNVISKTPEYFDEFWVDPYSEKVWEYNIAIAKELIERGFDEVQFDYIRFPTDGLNLLDTKYRNKEEGMDMESALISFLSYARENIKAPIGIDIYGSNGWYRTGSRTGQDVELLCSYVDVICPMFYPNHFEQIFLAYEPAIERPYRIYYYGTYRNSLIARDKALVRPWVQAFFLKVSYDVKYYNKDYVKREIYGVRDSMNNGYMYWNNSGRYEDISPDILDTDPYPWVEEPAVPLTTEKVEGKQ